MENPFKLDVEVCWVVGIGYRECDSPWLLIGVFRSEQEAINACRNESYFIGPVPVGVQLSDESEEWPGAYYPLAKRPC